MTAKVFDSIILSRFCETNANASHGAKKQIKIGDVDANNVVISKLSEMKNNNWIFR